MRGASCQIYRTSEDESRSFATFAEHEHIINEHNAGNSTCTLGHNRHSAHTLEKFQEKYRTGFSGKRFKNYAPKKGGLRSGLHVPENYKAPVSIDWVRDPA